MRARKLHSSAIFRTFRAKQILPYRLRGGKSRFEEIRERSNLEKLFVVVGSYARTVAALANEPTTLNAFQPSNLTAFYLHTMKIARAQLASNIM